MLCRPGNVEVWRILEINGPIMPPEKLFPTAGSDVAQIIEAMAPETFDQATGKLI